MKAIIRRVFILSLVAVVGGFAALAETPATAAAETGTNSASTSSQVTGETQLPPGPPSWPEQTDPGQAGRSGQASQSHWTGWSGQTNPWSKWPEVYTGNIPLDWNRLWQDQQLANWGYNSWVLDPLEVAKHDGPLFGLDSENDRFVLVRMTTWGTWSGTGEAEVLATHKGKVYRLQLIQPFGPGWGMIWTINSIKQETSWRDWTVTRTQHPKYYEYVVEPGDTLWKIATYFDVSMAEIMRVNHISDADQLWAGQVLQIPAR